MKLWFALVLFPVTPFAAANETPATPAEIIETLELTRKGPVLHALIAAAKRGHDPLAAKRILDAYESRIDQLLKDTLAGKPLFPCEIPQNSSRRPRLILSVERHDEARKHRRSLMERADRGEILYVVEGVIPGDEKSLRDWAEDQDENLKALPRNVRGMSEVLSEGLAAWMMRSQVMIPSTKLAEKEQDKLLEGRLEFVYAMIYDHDERKAYSIVKGGVSKSIVQEVFTLIHSFENPTDEKFAKLIENLKKAQYFADTSGWATSFPEMMREAFRLRYEKIATVEEMAQFEEFLKNPVINSDIANQIIVDWRNVDFAVNAAAHYCESLRMENPLPVYISTGILHTYGMRRLLYAGGGVVADVETTSSAVKTLRDVEASRAKAR